MDYAILKHAANEKEYLKMLQYLGLMSLTEQFVIISFSYILKMFRVNKARMSFSYFKKIFPVLKFTFSVQ